MPFEFEIAYELSRIVPSHTHAVQARIENAGRLLFTTDRQYPVITRGGPTRVDLVLRAVTPP